MMTKEKLEEISNLADYAHEIAFDFGADKDGNRKKMFTVADMLRRCKDEIERLYTIVDSADKMSIAWHDVKIIGSKNGHLTIEGVEGMNESYDSYIKKRSSNV